MEPGVSTFSRQLTDNAWEGANADGLSAEAMKIRVEDVFIWTLAMKAYASAEHATSP